MFRLNDAVRRYQAQHQSRRVVTLSLHARPETTWVVATSPLEPINLALLIEQLREEGALLQHEENTS